MKYKRWALLGISAVMVGAGLATSQTAQGQTPRPVANAPLALYGTGLMAHPEVLENVDGDPTNWIDQNQYDQIREYFLKQIEDTPAKRDKLWKVNFSSMAA